MQEWRKRRIKHLDEKAQALFEAVYENNLIKVQELIANGVDVNSQDQELYNPLNWAVANSNLCIIKTLLAKGAYVNSNNKCEWTSLHTAIKSDNPEIVEMLIQAGAYLNNKDNVLKQTPLHKAIVNNRTNTILVLLNYNASIDIAEEKQRDYFLNNTLSIFKQGTSYQKLKAWVNIFKTFSTILDDAKYGIQAKKVVMNLGDAWPNIDLSELKTTFMAKTVGDVSKTIGDLHNAIEFCLDNKDKYEESNPELYQSLQKLIPGLKESVNELKNHRTDLILEHVESETEISEFKEKLELFMNTYFISNKGEKDLNLFKDFITDYFVEDDALVNEIPISQQETKVLHLGDGAAAGGGCSEATSAP